MIRNKVKNTNVAMTGAVLFFFLTCSFCDFPNILALTSEKQSNAEYFSKWSLSRAVLRWVAYLRKQMR